MAAITHAAERKAFEVALGSVMKKVDKIFNGFPK